MPGRKSNPENYRFGFNGKENDNEIKGNGNSIDFGARMYDSRLGRWFASDPLEHKYPSLSTYAFVGNMPIIAIDPDGRDIIIVLNPNIDLDPEIQLDNIEMVLDRFYQTEEGKALLNEYIDNEEKHVFITIADLGYTNEHLGNTMVSKNKNTELHSKHSRSVIVDEEESVDRLIFTNSARFRPFEGVRINSDHENNFIQIDQMVNNIGISALNPRMKSGTQKALDVLGHEFNAHVGKSGNTEKEHNDYGEEGHKDPNTRGKAKKYRANSKKTRARYKPKKGRRKKDTRKIRSKENVRRGGMTYKCHTAN